MKLDHTIKFFTKCFSELQTFKFVEDNDMNYFSCWVSNPNFVFSLRIEELVKSKGSPQILKNVTTSGRAKRWFSEFYEIKQNLNKYDLAPTYTQITQG